MNALTIRSLPSASSRATAVSIFNFPAPLRPLIAARTYATQTGLGTAGAPQSRRKTVTAFNDDGRVAWGDLSGKEKVARTTQQSFNFSLIAVGIVLTVSFLTSVSALRDGDGLTGIRQELHIWCIQKSSLWIAKRRISTGRWIRSRRIPDVWNYWGTATRLLHMAKDRFPRGGGMIGRFRMLSANLLYWSWYWHWYRVKITKDRSNVEHLLMNIAVSVHQSGNFGFQLTNFRWKAHWTMDWCVCIWSRNHRTASSVISIYI